ncbi:hypothetical protein GGR50DRAFT_638251, partial [Xylaria sp. CBS 124048]
MASCARIITILPLIPLSSLHLTVPYKKMAAAATHTHIHTTYIPTTHTPPSPRSYVICGKVPYRKERKKKKCRLKKILSKFPYFFFKKKKKKTWA